MVPILNALAVERVGQRYGGLSWGRSLTELCFAILWCWTERGNLRNQ